MCRALMCTSVITTNIGLSINPLAPMCVYTAPSPTHQWALYVESLDGPRGGEKLADRARRAAAPLCSDVHGVDVGLVLGDDLAPLELLHGCEHLVLRRPQLLDQDDLG